MEVARPMQTLEHEAVPFGAGFPSLGSLPPLPSMTFSLTLPPLWKLEPSSPYAQQQQQQQQHEEQAQQQHAQQPQLVQGGPQQGAQQAELRAQQPVQQAQQQPSMVEVGALNPSPPAAADGGMGDGGLVPIGDTDLGSGSLDLHFIDPLLQAFMQQHGPGDLSGLGSLLPGMVPSPFLFGAAALLPGTTQENPLPSFVVQLPNRPLTMLQVPQADPNSFGAGSPSHSGAGGSLLSSQQQRMTPAPRRGGGSNGTPVGRGASASGGKGSGTGSDGGGLRSSKFRGVTKHRRSGRYEAHIWVKELGRQVYLGGYDTEEHAAEAYDIAALKCKGRRTKTNFVVTKYSDLLECIDRMSLEELIMSVRRQSKGFSRGSSSFRGVTRHPSGRWESRIGVPGSKHIYLGLFSEERDAARAYDRALVRLRGKAAATNFSLSEYRTEMADYHKMQAKSLKNDPFFEEISKTPQLFERWVKGGCDAFPELGSPHGSQLEGEGETTSVQGGQPPAPSDSPMANAPFHQHPAPFPAGAVPTIVTSIPATTLSPASIPPGAFPVFMPMPMPADLALLMAPHNSAATAMDAAAPAAATVGTMGFPASGVTAQQQQQAVPQSAATTTATGCAPGDEGDEDSVLCPPPKRHPSESANEVGDGAQLQ